MVYFFFAGMMVGLPAGCMLREKGYHLRFINAYRVIVPAPEAPKMDQFRDTRAEFYKDL